jgi:hypothetical protein
MTIEPVMKNGKPTGVYTYNGMVANCALELLGKEQGMFRDALDVKNTWDGDPKKLSAAHLKRSPRRLSLRSSVETWRRPRLRSERP